MEPSAVGDAGIVENANDVSDGVDVAQGGQAFAHALFLHAAQIDVLHVGVGDLFGIVELGEFERAEARALWQRRRAWLGRPWRRVALW